MEMQIPTTTNFHNCIDTVARLKYNENGRERGVA
jgi:hypothetical protein